MQVTAQETRTVQEVKEYDVFLDIDFAALKYNGKVSIDIESTGNIALDALDMDVTSVKAQGRTLPFKQEEGILEIQSGKFSGKLEIEYRGKASENLTGFYKAPYGDKYILSTHFEAGHARKLLPCVDNPAYKAVFKLTVQTDADLNVISNMPIESERKEGRKKTVAFQKTPKMSTYLVYLGVGHFEENQDRYNNTKLYTAAVVRPSGRIRTEYAFEAARKALEFYEKYFGVPYELPKLHMVAVPEFAYGAMENWGAVTFREILLHVDEDTSIRAKKSVAHVIAHEFAHMWFGDLVTMKWWDDLWLNESFATFMDYKSSDWAYPQWKVWHDFVRVSTAGAMARDALRSTHPIEAKVRKPGEVEELFDEISYGKGASILRMIEAYISPDKFQKGVRKYIDRFRYSNAAGKDLWNHLQEASGADVSRIMEGWIGKAGYPIVAASLSAGKLLLEQERFLLSADREKQIWPIPITMTMDGRTQLFLFDKEKTEVDVSNPRSLKLNVDQTGFYVVHYKGSELQNLVWKTKLSPLDRWGLVSDAKQLLLSGRMRFREYLDLVARYENEEEYLPAFEVSDQLSLFYQIAPEKIAPTARRFHSSELKILQNKRDENSSQLKGIVAARLTLLDEPYAKEAGSKFDDLAHVEPDMKRSVTMGYARTSNDYKGLIERFNKSTTDEERLRYLEALATIKKPELVAKALEFAIAGNVKRQDLGNTLAYATANPDVKNVTLQWFQNNIEKLHKVYEGTAQLSGLMRNYVSILGVGHVAELEKFFNEHPLPGTDATLERLKIYDRLAKAMTST